MITEIAQIEIKEGTAQQFIAAVEKAVPLFRQAKGCRAMRLERSIELPQVFRLFVDWNSLEDHTVHFRSSPAFQTWRELVGDYFATPPQIEHTEQVMTGF